MRRYLPLLLIAFFVLIIVLAGSFFLPGYADRQNPDNVTNITVYTNLPVEQISVLAQEYERVQNIKVNVVSLADNDLLARLKMEADKPRADIVIANRSLLETARKNECLVPSASEQTDIIAGRFKNAENYWTGIWYDPVVFAANQDFLKKLPQSPNKWSDLIKDSKWRIGLTDFLAADASANLLYTMVEINGESQTLAYLKKIHPQVVQYAKFLATPVRMAGMGEVDIAIAVQSEAIRYVNDSFPIQILYPEEGTAYLLTGAGLVKGTSHAADARQFIDWLLQDSAQITLRANKYFFNPTNPESYLAKGITEKNLNLLDIKSELTKEQKHMLMDQWVQTVRLSSK